MFFLGLFIVFYRVRFFNFARLKNIDNSIFICNHQSYADPVLLSIHLPYIPVFIARKTLLENKVFKVILPLFKETIFIPTSSFTAEIFKNIISKLKKTRKAVLLYPEGTRSLYNRILKFKKGFALLANILQRDIHLFYIKNSYFLFSKRFTISRLYTPISIYYLKKINYNIPPILLCKKVNEYYEQVGRRTG